MIQVIHRALNIVEYIAASGRKDVSLAEIANHLGLNQATCANIIKTLVIREYLVKSSKKGYGLGPMIYFLTGDTAYSVDLINASREPLNSLMKSINENCMVGVLRGDVRISLHEAYAEHDLRVINRREKKAVQTASGRVLLAYLPEKKIDEFIQNYGLPSEDVWKGVQSPDAFKEALVKIRKNGYAIQIASSGILGIAMPIKHNEKVMGGVGVFLPEFRFDDLTREHILTHLEHTAREIGAALA